METSGEAAIAQQERQPDDQTLFVEVRHGIVEKAIVAVFQSNSGAGWGAVGAVSKTGA